MHTLTITGNISSKLAQTIKDMVQAIDPNFKVDYSFKEKADEPRLSKDDANYLKKVVSKIENGEIYENNELINTKIYTTKQFKIKMQEQGFAW